MATLIARFRSIIGVLALVGLVALATPLAAQQPTSVNPTASSVKEDQLLQALQPGGAIAGRATLPDTKAASLERPDNRSWAAFHQVTQRWIGAIAILGMLALIVVFYLMRGMVRIEGGRSGRTIIRFNGFERFVHWLTAACFVVLALSGLNITFGKSLLLPLIGADAFTGLSQWGKYAHNYLSFPFTIGVVLIFLMWIAGNIPNGRDIEWLKQGGGLVGDKHPAAGRFNGGQKIIYWIVVIGGGAMAITGYMLMFPFYTTDIAGMQLAQIVHGVVSALFIAVMLAHIYVGSIGMEGAFEAMGSGEVDLNWAKEHHSLWVESELAQGRGATPPAHATPAE